jgi:hypothetical protein
LMPFGPTSEGQAFGYSQSARIEGDRLSGAYRMVQYPRWRADDIYLPDAHGMIKTNAGDEVVTHAAGYAAAVPGAPGQRAISHWMRFWTGSPELAWLNGTLACGVGSMVDDVARVRYFALAPALETSDAPAGAPCLELLGTARWEYPEHESVRTFGDEEGAGFGSSTGEVEGGILEGRWRGWHYPTYLRDGLYQSDAHIEILAAGGLILSRHAGLATAPAPPAGDLMYDVVQQATFLTEAPELAKLNQTLAVGVGFVRSPGSVKVSYYGLSRPESRSDAKQGPKGETSWQRTVRFRLAEFASSFSSRTTWRPPSIFTPWCWAFPWLSAGTATVMPCG